MPWRDDAAEFKLIDGSVADVCGKLLNSNAAPHGLSAKWIVNFTPVKHTRERAHARRQLRSFAQYVCRGMPKIVCDIPRTRC
jgi:hypothetical protein